MKPPLLLTLRSMDRGVENVPWHDNWNKTRTTTTTTTTNTTTTTRRAQKIVVFQMAQPRFLELSLFVFGLAVNLVLRHTPYYPTMLSRKKMIWKPCLARTREGHGQRRRAKKTTVEQQPCAQLHFKGHFLGFVERGNCFCVAIPPNSQCHFLAPF